MAQDRLTSRFNVMSEICTIKSSEDLRKFIHVVDHLHDALLHEAVLLHPGHVDRDLKMFDDAALPDVRLIFQSQLEEVGGIQLDLRRVSIFRFNFFREFFLEGEFDEGEVVLYISGKRNSETSEIRAAEAEYRILGELGLGSGYRLIRE